MTSEQQERFRSANHELRNFLDAVRALVRGAGEIEAADLQTLSRLLETMAPEMGAASREAALDAILGEAIAEYKTNLQNLQSALEQVRGVMLARRAQLDAAKQHMDTFQSWVSAYRRTA